jgi:hypothetical protein
MGCRCKERAAALVRSAEAAAKGDGRAVAAETTFVIKSAVEDATSALRQKAAAARSRLSGR